jgi:crossover junction endodeoxyribonuclease RuvC
MIIGGVDPGITGGISFFDNESSTLIALPCPIIINKKTKTKEYDIQGISELFIKYKPNICVVEKVHSMPKQGVSSTFFFGKGYGIILGIIGTLQIEKIDITPQKWKKYFSLIGEDKYQSILKASEIFPQYTHCWKLKKHNGVAESALIAYYGHFITENTIVFTE